MYQDLESVYAWSLNLTFICMAVPGVRVHGAVDDDAGGRGQLLLQHAPLRVPLAARGDAASRPQGPRHVPPLHRRMPGKYRVTHLVAD